MSLSLVRDSKLIVQHLQYPVMACKEESSSVSAENNNHLLNRLNTLIFRSYHSGLCFNRPREQPPSQLSFPKFLPCPGQVVIVVLLLRTVAQNNCFIFQDQSKLSFYYGYLKKWIIWIIKMPRRVILKTLQELWVTKYVNPYILL